MKIAFIDHHNGFSGGQKSLLVFLKFLQSRSIDFILIIDERKSLLYENLCNSGFEAKIRLQKLNVISSEIDNFSNIHKRPVELIRNIRLFYSVFEINKILKNENVDVIYANTFKAGLYAYFLNLFYRHTYVFRVRTSLVYSSHGFLDNLILSKASKLFSNSKYIESTIPEKYQRKTLTIYNNTTVDNKEFSNFYTGGILKVLVVGRITKRKRVHECLNYLRKFPNKSVHFYIAGKPEDSDSNYMSKLQSCIKQYGFEDKFTFFGHVDDITELMLQTHVIFLPSIHEPLSRVIIESLSLGCILITTNDSGNKELITTKKNGFLYFPGELNQLNECFNYITKVSLSDVSYMARKTYLENFSLNNTLVRELNELKDLN